MNRVSPQLIILWVVLWGASSTAFFWAILALGNTVRPSFPAPEHPGEFSQKLGYGIALLEGALVAAPVLGLVSMAIWWSCLRDSNINREGRWREGGVASKRSAKRCGMCWEYPRTRCQ